MSNYKKVVSLIITFALVLSLTACFTGPLKYTSNIYEHTTINQGSQIIDIPTNPQEPTTNGVQNPNQNNTEITTSTQEGVTGGEEQTTTAAPTLNPSSWTTAEILDFVTAAVTKTKAYTAKVTVNHTESFTADVTKAPGGSAVKKIANGIIESVVKPTDEVLTFNGGQTVNSENETVPLLLPKRGAFTLKTDGVASATARQSGSDIIVKITLVKEVGTLTDHPKHQAASVGYLDASDVDLGVVTLDYLNITYTGTTMELTINSNGYVSNAIYKIPIKVDCAGKALGMSAEIECEGEQSETWKINW